MSDPDWKEYTISEELLVAAQNHLWGYAEWLAKDKAYYESVLLRKKKHTTKLDRQNAKEMIDRHNKTLQGVKKLFWDLFHIRNPKAKE